jgi:multiple sugar transport system permease protein
MEVVTDTTRAVSVAPPRAVRQRWSAVQRRHLRTGILFISPWIIGFFLFTLYPMVASLYYSFTEFHIKKAPVWIGLENYVALFNDKLFWTALGNTLYLVVIGVPLTLLLSFICALVPTPVRGQSSTGNLLSAFHCPHRREHFVALIQTPAAVS